MSDTTRSYLDWNLFEGDSIPSSLDLYPKFYELVTDHNVRLLDMGCGYGKTCFHLLSKGYSQITGFDINESGIAFARAKLEQLNLASDTLCRFEIQNALKLDYETDQFDIGIMQAFLTTMPSPENRLAALCEARRVLKQGLYLAVFMQSWHSPKYYEKYVEGEIATKELGSFNARDKETDAIQYQAHHYSERELVDLIRESGFAIKSFDYKKFITRSGNQVNGAIIWAE